MNTPSTETPGQRRVMLMGGAVALSIIGSLAHNIREFGAASLLASQNGELPFVVVWALLFAAWWRVPRVRGLAAWSLVGLALLNLIGGALLTAFPLGFLPFTPEQSWYHYLSHIIYGTAQIPLIVFGLMTRRSVEERVVGESS